VKEDTCVCVDVDTCVCAEEETCVFTDSECLLEVSRIAFGPKPYDKELVDVEFDGSLFVITTPSGFSKGNDENSFSLSLSLSLSPPPYPRVSYIRNYARIGIHICKHTNTSTYIPTPLHTYLHSHTHSYTNTCSLRPTRTYIPYLHTYLGTHTHSYTNTHSLRHNRCRRRFVRHKPVYPFIATCSTERGIEKQQGSSRGCNRRCSQILKNQYILGLQSKYAEVLTFEKFFSIFF